MTAVRRPGVWEKFRGVKQFRSRYERGNPLYEQGLAELQP